MDPSGVYSIMTVLAFCSFTQAYGILVGCCLDA
jgi:hypothetical protein